MSKLPRTCSLPALLSGESSWRPASDDIARGEAEMRGGEAGKQQAGEEDAGGGKAKSGDVGGEAR